MCRAPRLSPSAGRIYVYYMATSVHIPKHLLAEVDRRARELQVSRNRLIVHALEKELQERTEWSPGFFDELLEKGPAAAVDVDALLRAVRAKRTRKAAPSL